MKNTVFPLLFVSSIATVSCIISRRPHEPLSESFDLSKESRISCEEKAWQILSSYEEMKANPVCVSFLLRMRSFESFRAEGRPAQFVVNEWRGILSRQAQHLGKRIAKFQDPNDPKRFLQSPSFQFHLAQSPEHRIDYSSMQELEKPRFQKILGSLPLLRKLVKTDATLTSESSSAERFRIKLNGALSLAGNANLECMLDAQKRLEQASGPESPDLTYLTFWELSGVYSHANSVCLSLDRIFESEFNVELATAFARSNLYFVPIEKRLWDFSDWMTFSAVLLHPLTIPRGPGIVDDGVMTAAESMNHDLSHASKIDRVRGMQKELLLLPMLHKKEERKDWLAQTWNALSKEYQKWQKFTDAVHSADVRDHFRSGAWADPFLDDETRIAWQELFDLLSEEQLRSAAKQYLLNLTHEDHHLHPGVHFLKRFQPRYSVFGEGGETSFKSCKTPGWVADNRRNSRKFRKRQFGYEADLAGAIYTCALALWVNQLVEKVNKM